MWWMCVICSQDLLRMGSGCAQGWYSGWCNGGCDIARTRIMTQLDEVISSILGICSTIYSYMYS